MKLSELIELLRQKHKANIESNTASLGDLDCYKPSGQELHADDIYIDYKLNDDGKDVLIIGD